MSLIDMVAIDFEKKLFALADWPDKSVIFDLTIFADTNSRFAAQIADVLVARIVGSQTHVALKLPLFYLVDCIMRTVGSPYIQLFCQHIVDVFNRVFSELHDLDKARLDYMLSTWEMRGVMPEELLGAMRHHIGTRIVNIMQMKPVI
jgi:hypothetical protein